MVWHHGSFIRQMPMHHLPIAYILDSRYPLRCDLPLLLLPLVQH